MLKVDGAIYVTLTSFFLSEESDVMPNLHLVMSAEYRQREYDRQMAAHHKRRAEQQAVEDKAISQVVQHSMGVRHQEDDRSLFAAFERERLWRAWGAGQRPSDIETAHNRIEAARERAFAKDVSQRETPIPVSFEVRSAEPQPPQRDLPIVAAMREIVSDLNPFKPRARRAQPGENT